MSAGTLLLQHCTADLVRGRVARADGHEEALTTREVELLSYMVERAGQTVTRAELLEDVWGYAPNVMSRACDNGMARLRNKLEKDPAHPNHLLTVHGEGYRFVPLAQDAAPVALVEVPEQHLQLGGRHIDLQRRRITGASEDDLTSAEAAVLVALVQAGGAVVDKSALSRASGGNSAGRGMANLVARLRAKIEDDPSEPRYLHTLRGVGYRLETGDVAPEGAVTLLFTDIQGSTVLWSHLDEAMAGVLAIHDQTLTDSVRAHGGYLVGLEGDGLVASFARPSQALRCAMDATVALRNAAWPVDFDANPALSSVAGTTAHLRGLRVRMAIHSGRPRSRLDVVTGRTTYAGSDVVVAARLVRAGHGGQVLATADALRDCGAMGLGFHDLGVHRLIGLSEPVTVFEVTEEDEAPGRFPALRAPSVRRTNLPPSTGGFIGREAVLAEIESAWDDGARLVVVTGPGGVGKTQLARAHGAAVLPRHSGGVWWCDLTASTDALGIVQQLAKALDLPQVHADGATQLGAVLQDRGPVLVVMDNAETVPSHLATLLGTWMAAAQDVRFLVTSQVPIPHPAARVIPLRPFDADDGIRLFLDHAARVVPDMPVTSEVEGAARRIVGALDGMPLAIALAAARVGVLSATQIADRLETTEALTPTVSHAGLLSDGSVDGRHRSMRTALDWTWAHLTEDERRLLRQLGTFASSFDHRAIEAVVDTPRDGMPLLDGVQRIVKLGLLQVVPDPGPRRFRLLSAIRDYAREQMPACDEMGGEADAVQRRHAVHYAEMGGTPFLHALRGLEFQGPLGRLMGSAAELALALRWAKQAGELAIAADLCMASAEVMGRVGPLAAAGKMLVEMADTPGVSTEQGLRLRLRSVHFHLVHADLDRAREMLDKAHDVLAEFDCPRLNVRAHVLDAAARNLAGEEDEPVALLQSILPVAEQMADPFYGTLVHFQLGLVKVLRFRRDSQAHLSRALAGFRAHGSRYLEGWCLTACSRVAHGQNDVASAEAFALASIEAYLEAGYRWRTGVTQGALASLYAELAQLDRSEAHFECAERIATETGHTELTARIAMWRVVVPIQRGDVGAARHGLERAKRLFGTRIPPLQRARIAIIEGHVLFLEDSAEESLAAYTSCSEQAVAIGSTYLDANANCSIGLVHLIGGDLEQAGPKLAAAHAIIDAAGLETMRAYVDGPRAEWLARTGEVEAGQRLIDAVLARTNEAEKPIQTGRDRCHAAHVALAAGHADEARRLLGLAARTVDALELLPKSLLARDVARLAAAIG